MLGPSGPLSRVKDYLFRKTGGVYWPLIGYSISNWKPKQRKASSLQQVALAPSSEEGRFGFLVLGYDSCLRVWASVTQCYESRQQFLAQTRAFYIHRKQGCSSPSLCADLQCLFKLTTYLAQWREKFHVRKKYTFLETKNKWRKRDKDPFFQSTVTLDLG